MSLARGVKRGHRFTIVQQHRMTAYLQVFDAYCRGETSAEHVRERGNKLKQTRRGKHG